MKPDGNKVCCVFDIPGWAWHRKASALQKHLNDDFRKFTIVKNKSFHKGLFAKYNLLHMFGWMDRRKLAGKYKGLTAGVSSHNFIALHPEKAKHYMPKYSALTAVSKLIYHELLARKLNKNIYYCPNGVDTDQFRPGKKTQNTDKLVIGWLGQPSGSGFSRSEGWDAHGYHNLLLPLMDSLKDKKDIHFEILARTHKNAKPWDAMFGWYHNIDIMLHVGVLTGTPNSIFEAAASGKAGISTAIGESPQLIKTTYNGHLVPRVCSKEDAKRCVEDIRALILKLNQSDVEEMGKNARKEVEEKWTWEQRAKAYIEVFNRHRKKI